MSGIGERHTSSGRSHAGGARELLLSAESDGRLDALCQRHAVRLLTLFGSAVERDDPGDLDFGYLPSDETMPLALLTDLVDLIEDDRIDLVNLRTAGPSARVAAMLGRGLYEDEPGLWARSRDLALRRFLDTEWIRRLEREALAR